ncbi:hypothetical protein PC121_g273 [Phytophthora cactorum]|nr:hypothetical protein PC120_g242 [Phytophthora cactorum]KAG3106000.1 hypothetical protein PC121_g273 [Phytophthora cactorum]
MPKPNLTDNDRKAVIDELLKLSYNGKLPRGAYAKVDSNMGRDPTTVSSIWKRYASAVAAGVVGGEWTSRIKENSGRKRKSRDEVRAKLVSVPVEDRAVERRVAEASGLSTHLIRQAVKKGIVRRQTTFIKPALTSENKMQRVEHALSFIDDATLRFEPMHNVVHVDETWFYADRNRHSHLVFDGEELPPRAWKSKRFIPKTMFLAALTRPRFDPHRKQRWNGKVGIWSFTEKYEAKRRSKNRAKGTLCTRNIDTVRSPSVSHAVRNYTILLSHC